MEWLWKLGFTREILEIDFDASAPCLGGCGNHSASEQVRVFVCVNPGICLELNDNIFDELVPQLKTERDAPGGGCMMAALGPEIARHNESVRHAAADGLTAIFDVLSTLVPGRTEAARRRVAITTYASSIGGLILARVTADDPELSDEILEAVVNF